MTSTRTRTLTALATTMLVALPLAACGSDSTEDPTAAATTPAAPTTTAEETTADPADATPQERIEAYFAASDSNAAKGWPDSDFVDEYLTPEIAEPLKEQNAENAETGAIVTGERKLSHWTVIEMTDTTAAIEFCDDTSNLKATKDGEPYDTSNTAEENIAHYELIRADDDSPWMINIRGYYEGEMSCAEHFSG